MSGFRRCKIALISSAAVAVIQPAVAQAQDEPAFETAEIIVTAQKREESINKVGLSITAVGADDLKERAITSLADVAQAVPGLSYTNSANNTPVYTLRGVGFYDTSLGSYPAVSTYLDQVPLPYPVLSTLTAFDLERVEVLKGPQGTLFGQNSTGGAINYIAAKPTQDFSGGLQLGYGRFDEFTGEGYLSGPLSETLSARVAVRGRHSGPWQKSYTRDDENGRKREIAGRVLVDWTPTDTLHFQLNINGWQDKSDPVAVQYVAFNPQSNVVPDVTANYPLAPERPRAADWSPQNGMFLNKRFGQISLRGDWEFAPDITLTSISSYLKYKGVGAQDQDGQTTQDLDLGRFNGKIRSFSQELRVANSGNSDVRWVVGANYSRDHVYYTEQLLYGDSTAFGLFGITTSENYSDQYMRNLAGFVNLQYDILPTLTLKGGMRYTDSRRRADICNHDGGDGRTAALFTAFYEAFSGGPVTPLGLQDCFAFDENLVPGLYKGNIDQDNLSWQAGIDFKPSPTTLIYANVSRGYKAGGFGNINASSQIQYVPVVHESILNVEGGVKAQFFDRRVALSGAVFYMDYTDKQLRTKLVDATFGILDALVNIPESHVEGAELQINATPTRGLSLGVAATYLKTRIDRYVGINAAGQQADFEGTPMPFTPKWQLGGNLRYETPVSGDLKAFAAGQINYRSSTSAIVGTDPTYKIDGYTLIDLQLGVEDEVSGWKAMLWGKNITNKYYWSNVVAAYDTVGRYAGMPAIYGITIGYSF